MIHFVNVKLIHMALKTKSNYDLWMPDYKGFIF